jgi:hypothetical protein
MARYPESQLEASISRLVHCRTERYRKMILDVLLDPKLIARRRVCAASDLAVHMRAGQIETRRPSPRRGARPPDPHDNTHPSVRNAVVATTDSDPQRVRTSRKFHTRGLSDSLCSRPWWCSLNVSAIQSPQWGLCHLIVVRVDTGAIVCRTVCLLPDAVQLAVRIPIAIVCTC